MADVRLTAINPEDSQVYPVACNDKGELLLDSGGASGDLDVTGNLSVAGTGDFGGDVQIGGIPAAGTADGFKAFASGSIDISKSVGTNAIFKGFTTGTVDETSRINANGSAIFAGQISTETVIQTSRFGTNVQLGAGDGDAFRIGSSAAGTIKLKYDGSATFAGDVQIGGDAVSTAGCYIGSNGTIKAARDDANSVFIGRSTDSNSVTFSVLGNGSATFAGNVTAPNINFKLAPADVAAMPAPLIDEGFAANNKVDLLSVLIEMKLQIRDLNAFMQRSTQDDPET